jgi:hypothetical protein
MSNAAMPPDVRKVFDLPNQSHLMLGLCPKTPRAKPIFE